MYFFMFRIFVSVLLFYCCASQNIFNPIVDDSYVLQQLPEDARLNFKQLGRKYGQKVEEYQVVTEDKYVLTLFRFSGNENGEPTLLMHGIADNSDAFILRGNTSLPVLLQEAGFDVWLGNSRGNKYSRKHLYLNPDKDFRYWDFSVNEVGYYDCPAMIDFITEKTRRQKISVIGHSQGNTAFYVLGATKPEYNNKIKVLVALAPVAYLDHVKQPLRSFIDFSENLNNLLISTGQEELNGEHSIMKTLLTIICMQQRIKYPLCIRGLIMSFAGHDKGFETGFLDVIMGHYPSPTSRKSLNHFAQISKSGRFAKYDYGRAKNIRLYSNPLPTKYDLSKVTMKVVMFSGQNDALATSSDVQRLRKELPNTIFHHFKDLNHISFLWGRDSHKIVAPKVISVLRKLSS